MKLTYDKVEVIPPKEKGVSRTEIEGIPSKHFRVSGYADLLKAFASDTVPLAVVGGYDREIIAGESIVSGLNGVLRKGEYPISVIRRGDAVYLVRGETRPTIDAITAERLLLNLDNTEEVDALDLTVPAEERMTTYKRLHYKRTSLGLGHLSVTLDKSDPSVIHVRKRGMGDE